jgi:hypothetical protein
MNKWDKFSTIYKLVITIDSINGKMNQDNVMCYTLIYLIHAAPI